MRSLPALASAVARMLAVAAAAASHLATFGLNRLGTRKLTRFWTHR